MIFFIEMPLDFGYSKRSDFLEGPLVDHIFVGPLLEILSFAGSEQITCFKTCFDICDFYQFASHISFELFLNLVLNLFHFMLLICF